MPATVQEPELIGADMTTLRGVGGCMHWKAEFPMVSVEVDREIGQWTVGARGAGETAAKRVRSSNELTPRSTTPRRSRWTSCKGKDAPAPSCFQVCSLDICVEIRAQLGSRNHVGIVAFVGHQELM
ncbi:hypothetical protein E2562_009264 [Oryza meyeriana var. granulata]|uniref:Uncharacterized protein n=1 Tax=Oryza meyeriana var. granulata TaxID=110450 RepID=A0A6G1EC68_9ORYZ|nr:hypothetical protein E2562_009264 [Oryza meyeriana var. granulata]